MKNIFLTIFLSLSILFVQCGFANSNNHPKNNPMWGFVKKTSSNALKIGLLNKNKKYYLIPGHGPLDLAALYGFVDVVKELSKDKQLLEKEGGEALYWAASMGNVEVMKFLMGAGISSNVKVLNNLTPIYSATEYGEVDAMCLLIKQGADINYQANVPYTLLELAVAEKQINAIKVLLSNGYKFNNKASDAKEILIAHKIGREDIVKLLSDKNVNNVCR